MIPTIVLGILTVGMFLSLYRLLRGPSLADRVVALDLIAILVVAIIAMYTVLTGQPVYVDEAVVLALIAFLGTIAFAYFIEKGELPWRKT